MRPLILFLTFAVIFATLVLQGLTLPILIRGLHITAESGDREETLARIKATRAAYATLNKLAREPWADRTVVEDLREHLSRTLAHHQGLSDHTLTPEQAGTAEAQRRIRRELNAAQYKEISRLHNEGAINSATMSKLTHELDLDEVSGQ